MVLLAAPDLFPVPFFCGEGQETSCYFGPAMLL